MKHLKLIFTTLVFSMLASVSIMASSLISGSATVSTLAPKVLTASDSSISNLTQYTATYTNSDVVSVEGKSVQGIIMPLTISKTGDVTITVVNPIASQGAYIKVYKDAACTVLADSSYCYMYSGSSADDAVWTFTVTGTYYVAFYSLSTTTTSYTNSAVFTMYEYVKSDATLANNTFLLQGESDYSNYYYYKIVTSKKGYITIQTNNQSLSFDLCDSSKAALWSSQSLSSSGDYKATFAVKAGTYYVKTRGAYDPYQLKYVFSTDPVIKKGKTVTMYPANSSQDIYVKYKATKTGYITLTNQNGSSCYTTMCNNKKKVKSSEDFLYTGKNVYGVQKGKTYYIKVNSYWEKVSLKLQFKAINDKSKNKKSKATLLKKGKTLKGVIPVGVGKGDWYKINVPSTKVVKLYTNGVSNGNLKVYIYDADSKHSTYVTISDESSTTKIYNDYVNGKWVLKKGTYYIKVVRGNSKSSGWYSLKWK